ncbi:MAG TPA: putative selenium-dependent hydroxylase accessory protein YqeC [Peptococcaceae bacterium]|nr:putative selenium-dependent hydroxylase accessory protein YqeC [Peptococcaceae bacterium]
MHLFIYGSSGIDKTALIQKALLEAGIRPLSIDAGKITLAAQSLGIPNAESLSQEGQVILYTRTEPEDTLSQNQVLDMLDRPCQVIGLIGDRTDPFIGKLLAHPLARRAELREDNRLAVAEVIHHFLVQASLAKSLGIDLKPRPDGLGQTIAIIGGGGKTTLLYMLARELAAHGQRVIVTTTTHIRKPTADQVPMTLTFDTATGEPLQTGRQLSEISAALDRYGLVAVLQPTDETDIRGEKKMGPPRGLLEALPQLADFILAEADGSRGLPLKAPASYEPVFPPHTDYVMVLAGLSALNQPLQKVCHRPHLAAQRLGCDLDHRIQPADIARLTIQSYGPQKDLPDRSRLRFLLNQADALLPDGPLGTHPPADALKTAQVLLELGADRVFITSLQSAVPVLQSFIKER